MDFDYCQSGDQKGGNPYPTPFPPPHQSSAFGDTCHVEQHSLRAGPRDVFVVDSAIPRAIKRQGTMIVIDATKICVSDHIDCGSQTEPGIRREVIHFRSHFVRMVLLRPMERSLSIDRHTVVESYGRHVQHPEVCSSGLVIRIVMETQYTIEVWFSLYIPLNLVQGEQEHGNDNGLVQSLPVSPEMRRAGTRPLGCSIE